MKLDYALSLGIYHEKKQAKLFFITGVLDCIIVGDKALLPFLLPKNRMLLMKRTSVALKSHHIRNNSFNKVILEARKVKYEGNILLICNSLKMGLDRKVTYKSNRVPILYSYYCISNNR